MAHEIEIVNGKAQFVYAGELPWHGLGENVSNDLLPVDMLEKAGLNWTVDKHPTFVEINGEKTYTGQEALVRSSDNSVLTHVSKGWEPVQNAEAFGFFHDFVMAGDMEMHTAGSLKEGKMVFALAKIKKEFTVGGKEDRVESFLLFSNPHEYGRCIDIRFTPIRVVCNNTLSMALGQNSDMVVRQNHRAKFDGSLVKEVLGISASKMDSYGEQANYLATKRFNKESISDYLREVFPVIGSNKREKEMSKPAREVYQLIETQPGADMNPDTWWNAFNSITYYTDHVAGRNQESRLRSSWYGLNRAKKEFALVKAVEYAENA